MKSMKAICDKLLCFGIYAVISALLTASASCDGLSDIIAAQVYGHDVLNKNSIEHLIPLPLARQSTDYTCGAAAALSLLMYYGDEALEAEIAQELGTNPDYGTDHRVIVKFFSSRGYQVTEHENMTVDELMESILQGRPVVCLIQAWEEDVSDYTNFWDIGHYVVAIGFDQERIYFMDPWTFGNYTYIPTQEFVRRWHQFTHDKQFLFQWGMAIYKKASAYNPDAILYMP